MDQVTVDNKCKEIEKVLQQHHILDQGEYYGHEDIDKEMFEKLCKGFTYNLDYNKIISFFDISRKKTFDKGLLFVLTGFYVSGIMGRVFYINYVDIEELNVVIKKGKRENNANLSIRFNDGHEIIISAKEYSKQGLYEALNELKEKTRSWDDIISFQPTGEIGKLKLTPQEEKECKDIIHKAALECGAGAGVLHVPIADNAAIAPIQIKMIIELGKTFGVEVNEALAKELLSSAVALLVGRNAVNVLVGWIPGVGNAISAVTALGITEGVGWMAVGHFKGKKGSRIAVKKAETMNANIVLRDSDIDAFQKNGIASFEITCDENELISLKAENVEDYIELSLVISYGNEDNRAKYIDAIINRFEQEFNKETKIDPSDKDLNNRYSKKKSEAK